MQARITMHIMIIRKVWAEILRPYTTPFLRDLTAAKTFLSLIMINYHFALCRRRFTIPSNRSIPGCEWYFLSLSITPSFFTFSYHYYEHLFSNLAYNVVENFNFWSGSSITGRSSIIFSYVISNSSNGRSKRNVSHKVKIFRRYHSLNNKYTPSLILSEKTTHA